MPPSGFHSTRYRRFPVARLLVARSGFLLVLLVLILLSIPAVLVGQRPAETDAWPFIRAEQGRLLAGECSFRFVSFNIPNLHLVEDNLDPEAETPWRWPDAFEIEDALESLRQMGGTVVRTYVLAVTRDGGDMRKHVHVIRPGEFQEQAFETLDLVLATARNKGIRVIVPFVDQWRWWGGIEQYAEFHGQPAEAFWTDPAIRADFLKTIDFVLARRNSITGVVYREDPTILGWETGNELRAPAAWTADIAAHLRARDPKHLIIDGCATGSVRESSLADPNIDVISTHHYPGEGVDIVEEVEAAARVIGGRKPYFVGEFGFISTAEAQRVLDTVVARDVCGALLWSLRFHRREGGFYWHSEPSGMGRFKAYHWPGFASGDAYDERQMLAQMRSAAARIQGKPDAPTPPRSPSCPKLLPIATPGDISWQGIAGAENYALERAESATGPWSVLDATIDDTRDPYRPLFQDQTALANVPYWYRVTANASPFTERRVSNVVGPVTFVARRKSDELHDRTHAADISPEARILEDEPRRSGEDPARLGLPPRAHVDYKVDGQIQAVRLRLLQRYPSAGVEVLASPNGKDFVALPDQPQFAKRAAGDYNYWPGTTFATAAVPADSSFLRIIATREGAVVDQAPGDCAVELSWIEIDYR